MIVDGVYEEAVKLQVNFYLQTLLSKFAIYKKPLFNVYILVCLYVS